MRNRNISGGGKLIGCFGVLFAIAFVGVFVAMIANLLWNYSLYHDCIADGRKAYQCKAMLGGNTQYVAIDDVSDN